MLATSTLCPGSDKVLFQIWPVHGVCGSGLHARDPRVSGVEVVEHFLAEGDGDEGPVVQQQHGADRDEDVAVVVVDFNLLRPQVDVVWSSR